MPEVVLPEPIEDGDRQWIRADVWKVHGGYEVYNASFLYRTKSGKWSAVARSSAYGVGRGAEVPRSVLLSAARALTSSRRRMGEEMCAEADRLDEWLTRQEPTP